MPAFYFQQLPLTHGVTLLRSQLRFPCWGKIRGGKACIFPRHGSLGIWRASLLPTNPSHVCSFCYSRKKPFDLDSRHFRGHKARSKAFLPQQDFRPLVYAVSLQTLFSSRSKPILPHVAFTVAVEGEREGIFSLVSG